MERFLKQHEGRIVGTVAGFDRILFRGGIRSLEYTKGLEQYLSRQSILHKDFKEFAYTEHGHRLSFSPVAAATFEHRPAIHRREGSERIFQSR